MKYEYAFAETSTGIEWAKVVGCPTCEQASEKGELPFIPHTNCLYHFTGGAIGHAHPVRGHCTANGCY